MKKTFMKILAGLLAVTGSLAAFGCSDRNETPPEEERPSQYMLADFESWRPTSRCAASRPPSAK